MTRPNVLPSAICTASAPRIGIFRGSMAGLCDPLSTLRRCPRGQLRMTRGRCGSLLLHRDGLAPSTPCGSPGALRLFPNYLEMEENYYERTKVWPIMHIIAIQTRVLDEHPWVARNLYNAFVESKRRSIERLLDPAVSRYPLAWLPTYARKMRDLFDGDPFPYGIEENRPTLEQFLRYTHEQGIAHRRAEPEEIFPRGIMTSVRV